MQKGKTQGISAPTHGGSTGPSKPAVIDPYADDPEKNARFLNGGPQQRVGSSAAERHDDNPTYTPGYGRPSEAQTRQSLKPQESWDQLFPTQQGLQQNAQSLHDHLNAPARTFATDPLSAPAGTAANALTNALTPAPLVHSSGAGSMAAGNAGSQAVGEEFAAGHPFVPSTARVHIPTPLTGPSGTPATDAIGLAQNQALYAPGGMSPHAAPQMDPYAPAAPAPVSVTQGTGATGPQTQINSPYGVAYSAPTAGNHYIGDESGDRTAEFSQKPPGIVAPKKPQIAAAAPQVDALSD